MSKGSNATVVANQPAGTNPEVQKEISLGMGAAQSGDKASAYRIFQSLATRYTDAPDVWVWLGGTSPNLDEAEAAFQRAVMLDPMNEEANLGLRWVTLRKHAIAEAASPNASSSTSTTSSLDTGVFTMGRHPSERLHRFSQLTHRWPCSVSKRSHRPPWNRPAQQLAQNHDYRRRPAFWLSPLFRRQTNRSR